MNKEEQIMQLVKEWLEEDKDKRSVMLTMIEVEGETEDGYTTSCSGVTAGIKLHLIDRFVSVYQDKKNPLYEILHLAHSEYMAKRLCGFSDRLSKGIEEEQ